MKIPSPLKLARLCAAAYEGGPEFTDVDDLRFGIFDHGDTAVVVFRGSANGPNWLRDLAALPAETKNGNLAHHGFVGAANTLWQPVTRAVAQLGKPTVFTGHSLGGAVAVLFAEALFCQAVTFGCPRPWWRLHRPPAVRHVRIVCDDDPVPKIPCISFRHDATDAVIVLDDKDCQLVNSEDHSINHYIARLEAAA